MHALLFVADWGDYAAYISQLEACLDMQLASGALPAVQPFHAFVYPIDLRKIKRLAVACASCRLCLLLTLSAACLSCALGFCRPPF